ncbi:hypothetical protein B0H17DRAFT_1128024 [Mycena rosella]|uniref:Uncharacterized protein n=1 Tax=Mycena rosella TaxID=1033263 RepID=A0AAD7E000_MYCRO|nr:hypothetical protein B0H17DRAFT_1128024 [Mycena rosella]
MCWVLIDEDVEMAVASSPSGVLPTSHVAAAAISAPPRTALPIATQAPHPVMLPPCPVTPAPAISHPATPMSPRSPFTLLNDPLSALGEIGNTPRSAKENHVDPEKGRPAITSMRPLISAAMGSSEVLTTGTTDIFGSPLLAPPIRLLSPLCLPSPAAVSLPSSSPTLLSPTSTLVGSDSPDKTAAAAISSELTPTSALKKRKAAETTLEPFSPHRSKGQAAAAVTAGGDKNDYDGGGSDADLDDDVAEAQRRRRATGNHVRSPCPQGGNRTHGGEAAAAWVTASTISKILQRLKAELDGEGVGERAEGADRGMEPDS